MARHKKEYTIEAIGQYFPYRRMLVGNLEYTVEVAKECATTAIQDMLRYDSGTVVYLAVVRESHSFTAIIKCRNYTPGRWNTFGIRTREVNYMDYIDTPKEVEKEYI